mgnify:CR=1 FL=1
MQSATMEVMEISYRHLDRYLIRHSWIGSFHSMLTDMPLQREEISWQRKLSRADQQGVMLEEWKAGL